ncbi:MAG: hypothetical protein FWD93_00265 [Coriobacteriia bacterium]|nr:hypothetical protein [Coriobacteriia bacterium]
MANGQSGKGQLDKAAGILGGNEITRYLKRGEIFQKDTWLETNVSTASYDLRVASDILVFGKKKYKRNNHLPSGEHIKIEPGETALLSTEERISLPDNIGGRVMIPFAYSRKGLVAHFGAQIAPGYGHDTNDERLYFLVCNLGKNTINIAPGDNKVFNMEFFFVHDALDPKKRGDLYEGRIEKWFFEEDNSSLDEGDEGSSLGALAPLRVEQRKFTKQLKEIKYEHEQLNKRIKGVEAGSTQVLLFGVFLVATSLLAVFCTAVLGFASYFLQNQATWTLGGWISVCGMVVGVSTFAIFAFFTYKISGKIVHEIRPKKAEANGVLKDSANQNSMAELTNVGTEATAEDSEAGDSKDEQ